MKKIKLSNEVIVTDPCYDTETWCQAKLTNVLPGNYVAECLLHDTGDWGVRVDKLLVVHEDYMLPRSIRQHSRINGKPEFDWEVHPEEIGVDSGQAGIFDMKSYRVDGIDMQVPEKTYDGKIFNLPIEEKGDEWYNKICKFTLSKEKWGSYESGVVCSSGFGDGGYTLYVSKSNDGKIVAMMIDFQVVEVENE